MCKILQVSRSNVYKWKESEKPQDSMTELIKAVFVKNQSVYGTRKIKVELTKLGYQVSRRRIGRIMAENGLVSAYTIKKYRVLATKVNEEKVENVVNREFDERADLEVIVSDLTYVRVKDKWNYVCILLNLFNREIIGYAASEHKNAELVRTAFSRIPHSLYKLGLFHSDRGSEFKNYALDELLETFEIKRSLSRKGTPYDNAVAEATFKIIKTEFVRNRWFSSLEQLQQELSEYVHWFNHDRIHSTLGYLSPIQYRNSTSNLST